MFILSEPESTSFKAVVMVGLTQQQTDDIFNALSVGMAPEDAFLFAHLSPTEINWVLEDAEAQAWVRGLQKHLEYSLLQDMRTGAQRQLTAGRTDGTQWLLEHLYPRYSAKATTDVGTINFVLRKDDTADIESVVGGE